MITAFVALRHWNSKKLVLVLCRHQQKTTVVLLALMISNVHLCRSVVTEENVESIVHYPTM